MTKINAEQLEKDIEAIPGVCADAKVAIKKLFENSFGVEFEEIVKVGSVVGSRSDARLIFEDNSANRNNGKYKVLSLTGVDKHPYTFSDLWGESTPAKAARGHKVIANSLEEYYRKKFEGKL